MRKYSRRSFIKKSAIGLSALGASSTLLGMLSSCSQSKISQKLMSQVINTGIDSNPPSDVTPVEPFKSNIFSKVAIVTSSDAIDNKGNINSNRTRSMLNRGIRELSGRQNLEEAWLSLFPKLSSDDVISIKVNTDNYLFPTHPDVVNAIINSLIEIGVKPNNIIIWDNMERNVYNGGLENCGYRINNSNDGIRCIATDTVGIGYDEDLTVIVNCLSHKSSPKNRFSKKALSEDLIVPITKIISQMSDYIINVPVLKSDSRFGVTGCMANCCGAIPLWDTGSINNIRKMCNNNGNPQIPELFNNPIIKNKVRLNILDSLLGVYSAGPYEHPQWINNQLIISKDPVAVDYNEMLIVEKKRRENGLPSILKHAKYIQTAAEIGLGTNNPEQMNIREVNLG